MRDTCLRCEQENVHTFLVLTVRGGVCPIHESEFIERLVTNAKITLGIPTKLDPRGAPGNHNVNGME